LTIALKKVKDSSLIPGFAVAVVDEKGILYSKGFGYANLKDSIPFEPGTIHGVASVSKTFVALSIMKLVDEKKLRLDEPINNILPYPIRNPWFPETPITVRHLLTHTSSIIDDAFVPYYIGEADICLEEDGPEYDSLPAYLHPNLEYYRMGKKISLDENIRKWTVPGERWYTDSTFLKKKPGTYFQYSNLGASIAARIVEIRSGLSFREFTRTYIFKPLHMNSSAWDLKDLPASRVSKIYAGDDEQKPGAVVQLPHYFMTNYPVSGLRTNASDLSAYLVEMIRGYNGKGKLLSAEAYKTLFAGQPVVDGMNRNDSTIFNDHYSKAVLWSISATGTRMHFGGNTGIYAFVYFDPARGRGALAYCNLRDDHFGEILATVAKYEPYLEGNTP
jgi:CubicO group peptidase (beta-lactamase class C family)